MTAQAIEVQGHRGARGLLPENTIPAFERAIELGVDVLELDLGLTRDGVPVVHHDRGLNPDRTRDAAGAWLSGPGPFIRTLDLGVCAAENDATIGGQEPRERVRWRRHFAPMSRTRCCCWRRMCAIGFRKDTLRTT